MIPRNIFFLVLFIGFSTLLHWLILILEIPVLQALPFWFFQFEEIPIQRVWILLAFVLLTAAACVRFSRSKTLIKLLLLILFGAMIQFSFAFSKGVGLDALRLRMVHQGHAQFASIAVEQASMLDVARNYDDLIEQELVPSAYTRSKPPGTVLFYMSVERLANLTAPNASPETRLENLRTFSSVTWPFITYIVLIPLFFLARQWFDKDAALTACLLYLSIPSVNLVTLQTDQTVYPLLAVVPVWLASMAALKKSYVYAFLVGVTFYLAAYFSFGLGTIVLLIALPFLLEIIQGFRNWKSILALTGTIALGAVTSDILARLLLNYDFYIRYTDAIRHHTKWQDWQGGLGNFLRASLTAATEFFVYLGIPLAILLFAALGLAIHQVLILRKADTAPLLSLALAGTFGLILLFGKTDSESARLWMFLIPFICLIAARLIHERAWTARSKILFVFYILLLELGTVYFTVRHQDFG
ncbi:MAG TPA: hypothetical protein VFZ43_05535 [Anaerolineales bacterium]